MTSRQKFHSEPNSGEPLRRTLLLLCKGRFNNLLISKYTTVEIYKQKWAFCNFYASLSGMETNSHNIKMDLWSYIFRKVLIKGKEIYWSTMNLVEICLLSYWNLLKLPQLKDLFWKVTLFWYVFFFKLKLEDFLTEDCTFYLLLFIMFISIKPYQYLVLFKAMTWILKRKNE